MTISSPVSLQKARELVVQLIEQKELEVGPQVMLNWCTQGCWTQPILVALSQIFLCTAPLSSSSCAQWSASTYCSRMCGMVDTICHQCGRNQLSHGYRKMCHFSCPCLICYLVTYIWRGSYTITNVGQYGKIFSSRFLYTVNSFLTVLCLSLCCVYLTD